jgi:membrane protein
VPPGYITRVAASSRPAAGVRRRIGELHPRRTLSALLDAFDRYDLLTYATAIAFNAIFAVIPLALFGLALLGILGAESVWTRHLAPDLRQEVSPAVFTVIDSSVRNVFRAREAFWVTIGAALAVWEVSGAMRAVMTVLDRIYSVRRRRGRFERYRVSLVLSLAVTILMVLAVLVFELAPVAGPALSTVLRWPLAAALLLAALAVVVRWAPAEHRPWRWVTFGSGLVVIAWLVMSAAFGLYLREIADYGSIFGNFATVIVAFEYAYLSAIVFLAGLSVDGIAQRS